MFDCLFASPVLFWAVRERASALNTIVRCASIASLVRWNMGLARRSVLLIRKDCSTCHSSWYEPMTSVAAMTVAGMLVT